MPTYSYRCNECRQVFLLNHGVLEVVVPVCERCGHFATRFVAVAPPTVGGQSGSEQDAQGESAHSEHHQCHGACVLHGRLDSFNPPHQIPEID